ncbi:MAG: GGDEF domain-containing protein [Spirochaetales bacterium]|nr:GGDEF domain-containing protein [Spirochaetales bacterium]
MADERRFANVVNAIFYVTLLFAVGVIIMASGSTRSNFLNLKTEPLEMVDDGWSVLYDNGEIEDFTDFNSRLDTNEITLSRIFIFPQDSWDDMLSFVAYNCSVEVFQNDIPIYSVGFGDMEAGFILAEYDVRCALNVIPGEASEITVHLKSTSPLAISPFYFGSAEDTVLNSVKNNLTVIIFIIVSFTMIVAMSIIGLFGRKKKIIPKSFLNFLLFLTNCSLWMLMNVRLLANFGLSPVLMGIGAHELFLCLPLTFSIFMYCVFSHLKPFDFALFVVALLNLVIANILHFAGISSFVSMITFTIIIIMGGLLLLVVQCVLEFVGEKRSILFILVIGLLALVGGSVMELITYFREYITRFSAFFIIGIMMFNFSQMAIIIRRFFEIIDEGRQASDYLSMARTDPLTGLGNRRALDFYISEISKNPASVIRVGCIVCDLNDLKQTNDLYGHLVGDQLIKDFAKCLSECFENRGVPFRTGGDEFYVLFSDVEVDMSAMMRRLMIGIEGSSPDAEYKISCSSGCYADYVPSHNEGAIWDIIKLADAEMYKQKKLDRQARLGSR